LAPALPIRSRNFLAAYLGDLDIASKHQQADRATEAARAKMNHMRPL
jgi:hypothetical protein